MWGAQEKSEGAHQKNFGRRFAPALCPPPLANCFRRHWNYTAHRRKASNGHLVLHTSNGAQSLTTAPIKGAELSRAVNECKNNWPPYMLAVEIGQRVSQSEKPVRSQ